MNKILLGIVSLSIILLLSACGQTEKDNTEHSGQHLQNPSTANISQKSGIVPSDEVCMVNDAFMGKKQLEVKFDGKTYYGCCEMCQERIPKDASVRVAIDPYSKKQIDKSTAIIAVTGDNGEVSYFENKSNYSLYSKQNNGSIN